MFFMGAIIIYAILGWVVPAGYSPPMALLAHHLRAGAAAISPHDSADRRTSICRRCGPLLALGVLLRLLPLLNASRVAAIAATIT